MRSSRGDGRRTLVVGQRLAQVRRTGVFGVVALEPLARAPQRLAEARLAHRFGQVVDGVHLERFHGVLVERRHEDHEGQIAASKQADDAEAIDLGHLDVEQRDVRAMALDELDRFGAVRRLADDGDIGDRSQRRAEK